MRSLSPARSRALLGGVLVLLTSALTAGFPPAALAASPSPAPAAVIPGMGAAQPCAAAVTFTANGKAVTRPLPATASQAGGAALAEGGLHVTPSATRQPPAPRATAWLVADLGTGQVLASCNAHVPLAPASSIKLLTALALLPMVDPATHYTARDEDARVDGTRVGLVPGSVYTPDNLWHALLMSSANDAAVALGQLAGGNPAATAAMRRTAQSLGAADTTALNTSGLDDPGQVSSAYDLALFGHAALADARLTTLAQTRSYAFPEAGTALPGSPGRKTFQIQNHDRLIYNYPGALGLKNGWTSTAGGSFVGAAERGGRRLVATVIAADPETWHMSAALLDWAFTATPAAAQGVGRLVSGPVAAVSAAAPGVAGQARGAAVPMGATSVAGTPIPPLTLAVGAGLVLVILGGGSAAAVRAARRR